MKKIVPGILFLSCLSTGYFYYKMNPGDLIPAIFFAVGLLGILFSYLRNQKK